MSGDRGPCEADLAWSACNVSPGSLVPVDPTDPTIPVDIPEAPVDTSSTVAVGLPVAPSTDAVTATVEVAAVRVADELPVTGLEPWMSGLALAVVAFGAALVRAARRR